MITNTRSATNPTLTGRKQLPREIRLGHIAFYEGSAYDAADFALEVFENFDAAYVPEEGGDENVVMTSEGEIDMGPCLNI